MFRGILLEGMDYIEEKEKNSYDAITKEKKYDGLKYVWNQIKKCFTKFIYIIEPNSSKIKELPKHFNKSQ